MNRPSNNQMNQNAQMNQVQMNGNDNNISEDFDNLVASKTKDDKPPQNQKQASKSAPPVQKQPVPPMQKQQAQVQVQAIRLIL